MVWTWREEVWYFREFHKILSQQSLHGWITAGGRLAKVNYQKKPSQNWDIITVLSAKNSTKIFPDTRREKNPIPGLVRRVHCVSSAGLTLEALHWLLSAALLWFHAREHWEGLPLSVTELLRDTHEHTCTVLFDMEDTDTVERGQAEDEGRESFIICCSIILGGGEARHFYFIYLVLILHTHWHIEAQGNRVWRVKADF